MAKALLAVALIWAIGVVGVWGMNRRVRHETGKSMWEVWQPPRRAVAIRSALYDLCVPIAAWVAYHFGFLNLAVASGVTAAAIFWGALALTGTVKSRHIRQASPNDGESQTP